MRTAPPRAGKPRRRKHGPAPYRPEPHPDIRWVHELWGALRPKDAKPKTAAEPSPETDQPTEKGKP